MARGEASEVDRSARTSRSYGYKELSGGQASAVNYAGEEMASGGAEKGKEREVVSARAKIVRRIVHGLPALARSWPHK